MLSSGRSRGRPGRRPQSEKRRRFLWLIARGWSVYAARREVGVSRTTGANWSRGYKIYKDGQVVGHIPALDPLLLAPISDRFLSQDERLQMADLRREGQSIRAIAHSLGRSPSTVSRELRRNAGADGQYRPFEAQRKAALRRQRRRPTRLMINPRLLAEVTERLTSRWSPQQISRDLHRHFPGETDMQLCAESIYQAIYRADSPLMAPPVVCEPGISPLRTGRDHRRAHIPGRGRRSRFTGTTLSIHQRPFPPEDRSTPGHWEGDLLVGPLHRSGIGTLVERQTRYVKLLHLPRQDSGTVTDALIKVLGALPPQLRLSLTWDQGTEMARYAAFTAKLNTAVYFCDPGAPWQRGSNENTNGLLRQYFPKGTDLSQHSLAELRRVEDELNRRPRAVLGHHSPAALFDQLLASESHSVLR